MNKTEIAFGAKSYFAWEHLKKSDKNLLLCCHDEASALSSYKQLQFFCGDKLSGRHILYFPGFDTIPYDRALPAPAISAGRAKILSKLAKNNNLKTIIVTAAQNVIVKLPSPEYFLDSSLEITTGKNLEIEVLIAFLVQNGFSRVASAVESSEFAVRGEIIDIVTAGNKSYRINFGWDQVETIKEYDPFSQISTKTIDNLTISPASEIIFNSQNILTFKKKFLNLFGVNHIKNPLYESVISGLKFQGYEHLMPLFYEKTSLIFDYLKEYEIIYDDLCTRSIARHEENFKEFYNSRLSSNKSNPDSYYLAAPVEQFIISFNNAKAILAQNNSIRLKAEKNKFFKALSDIAMQAKRDNKTIPDKIFDIFQENSSKIPVILCSSEINRERIKTVISGSGYLSRDIDNLTKAKKSIINIGIAPLSDSFISDTHVFISDEDILGSKFQYQNKKSSTKKLKNILTELDNIEEGELVVHKEHGIGRFEKIETIYVENIPHDCIKIIYSNNDILYLPVENIDQFKKFGSDEAVLDKLGSVGWQNRKARLKNKIRDIADKLIKITARRHLTAVRPTEFELGAYDEFCSRFPYNETEDQLSAVADIKTDLESGRLMDRLVCGDVGFGKTEVAMRAAFMVACDINEHSPQVAIIAPTTILCKQHYKNFVERFGNINLKIAELSRLTKPTEAAKIKKLIEEGKLNIIIGTHSLLTASIKFNNLRMLIIDEEHHFGVNQKEHLKQLKEGVHILSLSATPIPRTLQMSMVGIKELSIIATPPIDRLPVRTNLLPFDPVIIRDALMRERLRGGLSFYVAPRIKDIEWIAAQLDSIVPELKYKIAHGQMPAGRIDNIMNEFCDGKFDILLATTIIESGIDILGANTIIIHRADMLGLSQLYQLRGRVGRGKIRGHAYLTLMHTKITKHSTRRLEVLQNIESLGAGFTIASHDMDLRGFGNLVGDEQSGHIREVGTELYQEMLNAAIGELKNTTGNKPNLEFTPSIKLKVPVLIPEKYISESSLRLAIYRRTGDLKTNAEIESFKREMEDRFGLLPKEFLNLLEIVRLRNKCIKLRIEALDNGPSGFVIKFNKNFDVADMVLAFVVKHPGHAQVKPDNKLIFIKNLQPETLIKEAENILEELESIKIT